MSRRPGSDIRSGGQHFIMLTAASFCLFLLSYFLSCLAELDMSQAKNKTDSDTWLYQTGGAEICS